MFGFTCLVFKTTCIDRRIPLREGAFPFTRTALFPPLDKRNARDEAKGLRITSERHIVGLGARCLSRINRGQDSHQQPSIRGGFKPLLVGIPSSRRCGLHSHMTSSLMISKSDVYIVIAIALTRVVGKAYQRGGGWYASCVVESRSKEYTLSIPRWRGITIVC